MKRAVLAVAAAAALSAACGSSSPTAADNPTGRTGDGAFSTQLQPANACQARTISLAYTPVERRHVITVNYLDVNGARVFAAGCPEPVWSVAPAGARVQPLLDGSREVVQAELIVSGAAQVYTVTAVAGNMTASLGVSAR